jgi:hypothetical protein
MPRSAWWRRRPSRQTPVKRTAPNWAASARMPGSRTGFDQHERRPSRMPADGDAELVTRRSGLLAGGIVHIELWNSGYRHIPKIGPLVVANFVGSIALAAAVIASRRAGVAFAGITFAAGLLVALVLSRTVGVLGLTEAIWTTQATKALVTELGAIVALGAAPIMQRRVALEFAPATATTFKAEGRLSGRRNDQRDG